MFTAKLHCHPNHPDMKLTFEEREVKLNDQMGPWLNQKDCHYQGKTDLDFGEQPGYTQTKWVYRCCYEPDPLEKREYWYYTACVNHDDRGAIEDLLEHHAWYHVHSNLLTPFQHYQMLRRQLDVVGLIDDDVNDDKYYIHGVFCLKKNRNLQQVDRMFDNNKRDYSIFDFQPINRIAQVIGHVKHGKCYHEVGTCPVVRVIEY